MFIIDIFRKEFILITRKKSNSYEGGCMKNKIKALDFNELAEVEFKKV